MTNINWEQVAAWRDSLRTTKLGQECGGLFDSKYYPTKACCLGIYQFETQKREPSKIGFYYLDEIGVKGLGIETGNPKIFGIRATALNDLGIRLGDLAPMPGETARLASDRVAPLTFDEIADLLDIALLEGWGD